VNEIAARIEALYRLFDSCYDSCQGLNDPYGRSPDHQCYTVIPYKVTKVTARRIYFCDHHGRGYLIERAAFDAEGRAHHRKIGSALYLAPPALPSRSLPETRPTENCSPETISELRRAMADAHPDRGGDRDAFDAARTRYLAAKARAVG